LLFPAAAGAQVLLPPSVIQQQAERASKQASSNAASDPHAAHKEQHDQIEALRTTALGDDPAAAAAALHSLRGMGDAGKPALREVVRQLLARDRATLAKAATLPSAAEMRQLSDKVADERSAARANIKVLAHDETLQIAHQHYDSLKSMWEKLHGGIAQAEAISAAMARRHELLSLWHDLMPADKQYSDDSEARLAAQAQRAFGFTPAQLSSVGELADGQGPAEPVLRDIWFHRMCRRIAAFNMQAEKFMTAPELDNARTINTYREYLGVLPYEFDPRLVAAARDHTQEMVTLKYFDHASPVPENKTPWDRMRKAGYSAGSGENIAMGKGSERTFWMWFDSPPHHQNMSAVKHTAAGIGNVGKTWTLTMGSGPRLMLASPDERKAVFANVKPMPVLKDR
jgi:uncharacterized protein YkwD